MKKIILVVLFLTSSMSLLAKTSEQERSNKKIEFSLQFGGDYRMSPTQIGAMYFLNTNNLLGFKAGVDRTSEERQTSISLQFKHYTGNSFYVAPEIFYLNTREDVVGVWGDIFDIQKDYAEYTSLGAGIRIGNQWTWKYFTLGCDWIGVGHRVGTFKKETSSLGDTTITLLNVIVGISY